MNNAIHPSPCDLAEVFSQLEKADRITLQRAQIELARMQRDKEQQERSESVEARRVKERFGKGLRLGK